MCALRHSILPLPTILLVSILTAASDGSRSAQIVAQTERAFSSRCAEIGIRSAFLEYFAADAIHFDPGPRLAHPDLEHETSSLTPRLTWEPKIVRVASSDQLAISTGPYVLQGETGKQSFGYFLSVWKRQPGGDWKVSADIGVPSSQVCALPEDFQAYDNGSTSKPPEGSMLLAFEREQFDRDVDIPAIYQPLLLPETVLERADLPLMPGERAYQSFLAKLKTKRTKVSQAGGDVSGNLGFTYGTQSGDNSPTESYLRVWIWRRSHWSLLFDVAANLE
jgi:hypothetical protein